MGYDGSVKIGTELDKKGLQKGLSSVGSLAKKGFSALGSAAQSAASVATGAITGVSTAMAGLTTMGVKYNAEIETYQTSFEVMTGSAEKAVAVMDELTELGASTPFEFTDLANATQLLMNFGFEADEAVESFKMLGDISQGNADALNSIARAYGKMNSAGKVSLEDINMMIDAGFNPLQEISESTEESMASLYERISDGALSVDEITASMQRSTAEGGKYYQSMEKQSQTINGMISTLQDNAQQLVGDVVQPITESIGTTLLPAAIDALDQLSTAFQENGAEGLIQAGMNIITNVLQGVLESAPSVIESATNIITTFCDSLKLATGLTDAAAELITTLVSALIENAGEIAITAIVLAGKMASGLVEGIPLIIESASLVIGDVINALAEWMPDFIDAGISIVSSLIDGIIENAPEILNQAVFLVTSFVGAVSDKLPDIVSKGKDILTNLLKGITEKAPDIEKKADSIISDWLEKITEKLPNILEKGKEIILNILEGLIQNAPNVLEQAGDMLVSWIGTILDCLPDVLECGKDLILELLGALVENAPEIITQAGTMIADWLYEIATHLPEILTKGGEIILELLAGMIEAIPELISNIPGMISDIGSKFLEKDWGSIGSNIIDGIKTGVSNAAGGLVDAAVSAAKNAIDTVKRWLGIRSPSRRARDEIGVNMIAGIGEGVEEETPELEKASKKSAEKAIESMKSAQAEDFVAQMQAGSYKAAEENDMSARNRYHNNGYDPEEPDDNTEIVINNHFDVNGKPLVDETVRKTKREIAKEQRSEQAVKGDVQFA